MKAEPVTESETVIQYTYTFPGPVIVKQFSLVQNSEITPYIKFTWLKNDIAATEEKYIHY